MIGLPIAVALGAIIGKSEYRLEVLKDCDEEAVERGKRFIAENRIQISLEEEDPDKLYIRAICRADQHEGEAIGREPSQKRDCLEQTTEVNDKKR